MSTDQPATTTNIGWATRHGSELLAGLRLALAAQPRHTGRPLATPARPVEPPKRRHRRKAKARRALRLAAQAARAAAAPAAVYFVETWDPELLRYTPQIGVPAGPYTRMRLRAAVRELRALGYEVTRDDGMVRIRRGRPTQ